VRRAARIVGRDLVGPEAKKKGITRGKNWREKSNEQDEIGGVDCEGKGNEWKGKKKDMVRRLGLARGEKVLGTVKCKVNR